MTIDRDDAIHPIGVAARRAGITPDVIRAWERRYGVVDPARDDAGRRVYTSENVRRLQLLARATEGGHSIGQVAALSTSDLEDLVREDEVARGASTPTVRAPDAAEDAVEGAMARVRALDAPGLEALLLRLAAVQGVPILLKATVVPLFRAIGEEWHDGRLSPAQEHLASASVRDILARLLAGVPVPTGAPGMVVATPAGERHEIGALLATATATLEGWRVVHLGSDLAAAEIAAAARRTRARAVAVSAVYAPQPEALRDELLALREELPDDVTLLVGGPASSSLAGDLEVPGALVLTDLEELATHLRAMAASTSRTS